MLNLAIDKVSNRKKNVNVNDNIKNKADDVLYSLYYGTLFI